MAQEDTATAARTPAPDDPVVAFDFDGTLTIRDSFSAFLKWRAGPLRWWVGCLRLAPAGLAYALQERGLVHRSPDPEDGRLGVVELTPAGLELVEAAVTDHVATLDRMLADVPVSQREALTAALAAVERNAVPDRAR